MKVEPGLYLDTREGGFYRTIGEVIERRGERFVIFHPTYDEDDIEYVDGNRLRYMKREEEDSEEGVPYTPDITPQNSLELYEYSCRLDNSLRVEDINLAMFKHFIKDSLFTGKMDVKNGEVCIRERNNMRNSTVIFYEFGARLCPYPSQGEIAYFYRGVRPSLTYNPQEWEIGSVFPQYIPFSTSIVPEFSLNWSGERCCFFKINANIDKNFFFICANDLLDKEKKSQMEATLPPGVFTVKSKITLDYKGSNKTFLELDYNPWSLEEWSENFSDVREC